MKVEIMTEKTMMMQLHKHLFMRQEKRKKCNKILHASTLKKNQQIEIQLNSFRIIFKLDIQHFKNKMKKGLCHRFVLVQLFSFFEKSSTCKNAC